MFVYIYVYTLCPLKLCMRIQGAFDVDFYKNQC